MDRLRRPAIPVVVVALVALTVVVAVAALALADRGDDDRKAAYLTLRSINDRRDVREHRLRKAFSDLDAAADKGDRAAALAAIDRGRATIEEIDDLLAAEIRAATALARFDGVATDAKRVEDGLRKSRAGLALFARELEIGKDDPFLEQGGNQDEVNRLAREGARLSIEGELAIRRADRALALAVGVEPNFDPLFDELTRGP